MSMHNTPLTIIEETGLIAHGFGRDIGKPSMAADIFRSGVAWGQASAEEKIADIQKELAHGMPFDEKLRSRYEELLALLISESTKPAQEPAFPMRDLSKSAEQQGIFQKFDVRRTDGSSEQGGKHYDCKYFVLDLDHDPHAPAAMQAYAEKCKETHPVLSAEIFAQYGEPAQEPVGSDYTVLIGRLAYALKKASPESDLPNKATEFLKRKGHTFDPLRDVQDPVKQESWISVEERLPEVKPEDYEFVLVSVDSAHTGKTHVFEAAYLNQLQIMTEDGDYTSFTGWHTRSEHPDYDGWYEPIGSNGDERVVTHWMKKPLPPVSEV